MNPHTKQRQNIKATKTDKVSLYYGVGVNIKEKLPGIKRNISLAKNTTFKIGGPAKYFFLAKRKEELITAIKAAKNLKLPFFILGGGSNILFSDKGYKGLVIKFQVSSFKFQDNNIYAQAGVKLEDIVKLSLKKSLTGLEWAAGIPGTVGGAVYGNIGAFGFKIADAIKSVEVLNSKTLKIKNFSPENCKLSNKDTIFKHKKNLIILSVIFKLKKEDKKEIQKKIKKYLNYRKKNHPLNFPSAGCAFKNYEAIIKNQKLLKKYPELRDFNKTGIIPASYLIDKAGLKGKKIGGAQISKKHANFIINLGKVHPHTKRALHSVQKNKICARCGVGARAKDVLKLIKLAKQKVKNKFGIDLEEEIQILK